MTESEARSKIKYRLETARQIAGNGVDGKAFEDLEIAVQVLKEIREYREIGKAEEIKKCIHSLATSCDELKDMLTKYEAIGTVEELQSMKENGAFSGAELSQIASNQMKLKKYMEIGTVEEFKALKDKNEPKKPIMATNMMLKDRVFICPNCEIKMPLKFKYCNHCGQKLDWGVKDE